MNSPFPLVTLRPAADDRNAWAALLFDAVPADGEAVARVFGEFGLTEALGPLPCVLSFADPGAVPDILPASRIVLRLPVALCCDPGRDGELQALRDRGFRLMADGLPPAGAQLSETIQSLAIGCPEGDAPAGLGVWLGKLPGPHLALDATAGGCPGGCHFHWRAGPAADAARHGGHFRPAVDAPNRLLLLELLSKVANDADSHDIEATIKRDPQLSYYLLKLVNSVGFGLTTKIASFNQAITMLGRRQLQRWLQLLLYARTRDGDKANALLPRAAMRAGLAEALCRAQGGAHEAHDRAFMAGMFSLLDLLFGMPIEEIMAPLNLADDVLAALTRRSGPLGPLLRAVAAGETAAGEELAVALADAGVDRETWARCLASACRWAVQVSCEA